MKDPIFKRLLELHPKFSDLSLTRINKLLKKLNFNEKKLPQVIHIAGTNGKGSTALFPDFDFPCKIEMSCSEFQKVIRDLREFGDDVILTVSPKTLKFYTVSGGEHIQVDYSSCSNVKIASEASIEVSFALKYLAFFCKACPLSDFVHIYLGVSQPMRLNFPISESEYLSFYLAPKVDDGS